MSAHEVLKAATNTFKERHDVYGDNYLVVGEVMKALFPSGIYLQDEDDHNRFHLFMLQIVKLTRYTQNWDNGGHEDSLLDLSVYAAMLVDVDRKINDRGGDL